MLASGGGAGGTCDKRCAVTFGTGDLHARLAHRTGSRSLRTDDFTEMTVKLREGIYWSDGVEFTADDLIYTVETMKNTEGMTYTGQFSKYVDTIEKPDNYTVVFNLTEPNSRFHGLFTVRWSACFMMPKHIFENVEDPVAFTFNPPVSLGAYTLRDSDPNGKWFLWERREDWQRTSLARLGDVTVKYAMYIDPGPSDARVLAQTAHQLDVIHDCTPEGRITLARTSPKLWLAEEITQPTSEGVNSITVCQPSVMMLVSPRQADDSSTIGPGSR